MLLPLLGRDVLLAQLGPRRLPAFVVMADVAHLRHGRKKRRNLGAAVAVDAPRLLLQFLSCCCFPSPVEPWLWAVTVGCVCLCLCLSEVERGGRESAAHVYVVQYVLLVVAARPQEEKEMNHPVNVNIQFKQDPNFTFFSVVGISSQMVRLSDYLCCSLQLLSQKTCR